MTLRLPIAIILALAASSHSFLTPLSVGRPQAALALGKGILEMAEVDASTVFPAEQTIKDQSFLGNYEDLVMPGKEGHGYQLIFEDDESFRLYVKQQQRAASPDEARQRARANIGYNLDSDVVGHVPETRASPIQQMRENIDFFSSHAVVGTILDQPVQDASQARIAARDNIGYFSDVSAKKLPKDTISDSSATRSRARENIDFFTLKEHTQVLHTMEEARKVARNNIDFFSAKSSPVVENAKDESKERATARLNIGFFS